MPWYDIVWDHSHGGNVEHLADHGITTDEAEEVIMYPSGIEYSRSSGRCIAFGRTHRGRSIAVVYELLSDKVTVLPVTAFDVEN